MKHSRKVVAVGLVAAVAAIVATGASGGKRASILACGLMPDTKTSVRWEQFDRPYLEKAFKAAMSRPVSSTPRATRRSRSRRRISASPTARRC